MNLVYISIGTNIGDKLKNINDAIDAINHLPSTNVIRVSSVYETAPWGYLEQDNFYNICAAVETDFSPNAFLGACLGIEAAFGRERPFKYSPRIIDIDVLLYNDLKINTSELTVPHPRMSERAFVLVPLKDVLPDMNDFEDAYENCDKNGINKIENT
ncbi:MAG: 2-amino-4-hydroxy-6-hydroxymethyldihydropteridine diphosphokinase [Clostridia bacterium]|nr:2-amino-4-hydroxy-6-hydroxymethyldihydropteridine diphosphokinase [Clostridia bacterium]